MIKDFKTYTTPRGWVVQMDLDDGTSHSMAVDRGSFRSESDMIESGMRFFLAALRMSGRREEMNEKVEK